MAAADTYVELLAQGIVASIHGDPPPGLPARVVIRWFDGPAYLTIHVLGTDEEPGVAADDAWSPLEWPNATREIERAGVVLAQPGLAAAVDALARRSTRYPPGERSSS
ncbi:MAG: hypothetical protein AVDCRST_MAG67-3520 [uncultured Solirubrobacteraceae bacterium]|uniref:Uncharacterized protein n=1 Tax=uncultured Solirubrobacteraceae bacterium TaxID=1162706 RepID=A0A6J4TIB7_9ACTN|nr:MAG: hypothetical protein AVDCRST_MAG67-3520 [uncultured Solirubrobacteraceae bacterium]